MVVFIWKSNENIRISEILVYTDSILAHFLGVLSEINSNVRSMSNYWEKENFMLEQKKLR